jgi:hypothetical protein
MGDASIETVLKLWGPERRRRRQAVSTFQRGDDLQLEDCAPLQRASRSPVLRTTCAQRQSPAAQCRSNMTAGSIANGTRSKTRSQDQDWRA